MKLRQFQPEDYPLVVEWWKTHGFQILWPETGLPRLGYFCVDTDETKLAVGWVFLDNTCNIGMMTLLTTNPDISALRAGRGMRVLVDGLAYIASDMGWPNLLCWAGQMSLQRMLRNSGWTPNHHAMEFMKHTPKEES